MIFSKHALQNKTEIEIAAHLYSPEFLIMIPAENNAITLLSFKRSAKILSPKSRLKYCFLNMHCLLCIFSLVKFCKLPTNCFNVFDHFVGLVLKGLRNIWKWLKFF